MTIRFNPWSGCSKVSLGCTNCYAEVNYSVKVRGVKWGPNGNRIVKAESGWKEPIAWNKKAACDCFLRSDLGEFHLSSCPQHQTNRPRVFCASLADVFEDWQGPILSASKPEHQTDCPECGTKDAKLVPAFDSQRIGFNGHLGTWKPIGRDLDKYPLEGWRWATMDDVRARLFRLIDAMPNLDWLLLTKRPENVLKMTFDAWCKKVPGHVSQNEGDGRHWHWPKNVWLGVSVEDQKRADERIPLLMQTPAAVRFLSCEPLLGPIDLQRSCALACPNRGKGCLMGDKRTERLIVQSDEGGIIQECICSRLNGLHWVIVGGESGPGARPCSIDWIRDIVRQCKAASVPCFVKQLGSLPMLEECKETVPEKIMAHGRDWPEGTHFGNQTGDRAWNGRQILLHDKKGGDPSEWGEDLRVREFPRVVAEGARII